MTRVVIVGTGLVGGLAALALRHQGFEVEMFEMRDDPRSAAVITKTNLRSINLAFSARGISSLESIEPEACKRIMGSAVPLHSRAVHAKDGSISKQPYGLYGETINSVNRALMSRQLIDEVEAKGVVVNFNCELIGADFRGAGQSSLTFKKNNNGTYDIVDTKADVVLGCDGANSAVRNQMFRITPIDYTQHFIDHCYFELKAPKDCGLDKNCFHVWPRTDFMTIAMANADDSFVVTLFATRKYLEVDEDQWIKFMKAEFPDLCEIIGDDLLSKSYKANKVNTLGTVSCNKYNYKGKVLLLGDAGHAIVPFYGQGMNAGFEDVKVLMEILKRNSFDFERSFDEYSLLRKPDLDAISALSLRNYTELGHDVATPSYLLRKKIDSILSLRLKDKWLPLYSMVTFRPDLSYSDALKKYNWQTALLKTVVDGAIAAVSLGAIVSIYANRSLLDRLYR